MRPLSALAALALPVAAAPASAATIIVYTDPMSLNRYTVVLDTPGPNRVLMCTPPPGSTCVQVPARVRRTRG